METTASRSSVHYAWIVLAVGTLVVFGSLGLGRFAFTPILPDMQDGLGLSNDQAGALATGNNVGYLLLAVVGGVLAARFGPRVVISLSMLLIGLTMILTGMAQSFWPAFVWRFLSGLGSGGSNVPVMALMAAWFASRRRGVAMGVAVAGSSIGLILTGYIVPPLLIGSSDGWRTAWLVLGGIVLLMALLSWAVLRDRPQERGLEPLGGVEGRPAGQRTSALDWRAVYRLGVVWHLAAIYVAFGYSYVIYTTFFSSYLVKEVGLTDHAAGRLWSMVGFLSLFCGVIWGAVSDRWGRNVGLVGVFLGHAAAYAIFALADGMPGYVLSGLLFGVTAWSIPAIVAAACGDQVGSRLAPAALGLVTLFFGIGQAAGPYVAGLLADRLGTFVPAFLMAAGVALLGAVVSALLRARREGETASV